jgi:outer membrane immunogenic protein
MKKFLLAAVGFVALGMAAPAVAADMPVAYSKSPTLFAALYDWSGFYLGANGGWGSSHKCWDGITPAGVFIGSDGCHDATGGLAGAQMGFRWQYGALVVGMEAQGDWASLRGSSVSLLTPANTNRSRIDAFGLFTGQIGYAFNTVLLYVKGGAALAADRFDQVATGTNVTVAAADSRNHWGGTVGAGVEFSFAPNWSAAVEYDRLFLGSQNVPFNSPPPPVVLSTERIRQDADLVTVRVNYRWGGPVIAKY